MVSIDKPNQEIIYDKAIIHRISRSTGHLRSVKTMIENDRDCSEILIQLSAVKSEIAGTSRAVLKQYLEESINQAVSYDEIEKLKNVSQILDLILK